MMEKLKFVCITRVIDPKTRIHYLDAIDINGRHWTAQMTHTEEPWRIIYKEVWKEDSQQPYDL